MKTKNFFLNKYASVLLCSLMLLFSCSKKDDPSKEPDLDERLQLVIKASSTETMEGQEITFEITADGEVIDAEIYVDNDKISGASYTFEEAGAYTAFAKKEGYIDSEKNTIIVKEQEYQTDVYISGNDNIGSKTVAKYWKNGTPIALSDGSQSAVAHSIVVNSGDVYVVGSDNDGSGGIAVYWKNGTRVTMTTSSKYPMSYGRSIAVDNGNVYVSGEQKSVGHSAATYWKDGTPVKLADDGRANSIVVVNEEVHVVGEGYDHPDYLAKYWKNGTLVKLTNGSQNSIATSVTADNEDVYVAGFEYIDHGYSATRSITKYWKNGTPVELGEHAIPVGIVIDNGDVYVAAKDYSNNKNKAKYWKNDTSVALTDGHFIAGANAITVNDGDVYVAGYENSKAVYWKNGEAVILESNGNAEATSIFLVKRPVE